MSRPRNRLFKAYKKGFNSLSVFSPPAYMIDSDINLCSIFQARQCAKAFSNCLGNTYRLLHCTNQLFELQYLQLEIEVNHFSVLFDRF